MKIHDLIQGNAEWLAHRAGTYNASDAPSMAGCSPYLSRNDLIKRIATGIEKEVDSATQRIFDDGHRFEALSRPLAEKIVGEDLYPVTGSAEFGLARALGASFDGLTMMEDTAYEHKTLNDEIRAALPLEGMNENATLPKLYRVQMEQQMMVSGARRVLFMASKWEQRHDESVCIEERHCWYYPDEALRAEILAGWKQLEADVAAYVPAVEVAEVVAAAQPTLPAVAVQVSGQIAVRDNLSVFGDALKAYIERINKQPESDQDFADLDATVKKLKEVEECLSASEANAIAQTGDVDALCRTINDLRELARQNRLTVEKIVKAEKENRKNAIIEGGRKALAAHISSLTDSLKRVQMPSVAADFNGCAKNLRTISSLQNAVDTCLANAKIEANQIADGIRYNLTTYDEIGAEFPQLFPDLAQIVTKAKDDFTSTVKLRISEHKEAERQRLEREAEAARVAEEQRQQRERDAEAQRQQQAGQTAAKVIEQDRTETATPAATAAEPVAQVQEQPVATNVTALRSSSPGRSMTDDEIADAIANCVRQMDRAKRIQILEACKQKLAA
jgi:putative phage-type endonuclease